MIGQRRVSIRGAVSGDTLAIGQPNPSIYARRETVLWYFPDNQDTLQFVDPDSSGDLVKQVRCKQFNPQGQCVKGDSVFVFQHVQGPHNGFALYYTITYGSVDRTLKETADMFVPASLDAYSRSRTP